MANTRDDQIATINATSEGLNEDRVQDCRTKILDAYKGSSIVDQVTFVAEIDDREPSDFHVLSNSEARRVDHFNDPSYHWDFYCEELARSITIAEKKLILETLGSIPGDGQPIDAANPSVQPISTGIEVMRAKGHEPSILVAPISLYMPVFKQFEIDQLSGRFAILPDGSKIEIFWSSRGAPIDRFVLLDPAAGQWQVELDPNTKERLTVAIGRHLAPPGGVTILAETVCKYDIVNKERLYVIEVTGEPSAELGIEESTRQEGEPANG